MYKINLELNSKEPYVDSKIKQKDLGRGSRMEKTEKDSWDG